MLQLDAKSVVMGIARNQAHRVLGGARRGGHRVQSWVSTEQTIHTDYIYGVLAPYFDDLHDSVALEIGPGDSLGVSVRLKEAGCRRVYATDKYAQPVSADGVELVQCLIEDFDAPEPLDLIISNDVLEHVGDLDSTMRRCYQLLRPGGQFVSNVDLRGHNAFNKPDQPLDFLSCPDWLYRAMHSHIETSNRVRMPDLITATEAAGFLTDAITPIDLAEPDYVESIRPHLLPRYRDLTDDQLRPVQVVLALRKPRTDDGRLNRPR